MLNDNGAWSWFEDERVVIDHDRCVLLFSSVADARGSSGQDRDGAIEVVVRDLVTQRTTRSKLHVGASGNDHNSAALYVRGDGHYLAMYSVQGTTLTRWRLSRRPGDGTAWGPEHVVDNHASTTYSNIYATDDNRLYAFIRSAGQDPHFLISDDDGSTWTPGGRLLANPGRPYVRYASDGAGRIHLVATDGQPSGDERVTGIYHGVISGGQLLRSDGGVVDPDMFDRTTPSTGQLTPVFGASARIRPWIIDVELDAQGRPHVIFSVRITGSTAQEDRRRYWYGRFDGLSWHVHPMARAGSALSPRHRDYTGLAALDPGQPARAYISTDVDPVTGTPLISETDDKQHFEIFEGLTVDGGATWEWTPLTEDSTAENIRPIVPKSEDGRAVLWLRGTYSDYRSYDLDVVGLLPDGCTRSVP